MNPSIVEIETAFKKKSAKGVVKKQDINSYELIEAIMRKGLSEGVIWWFAYELMGFHEIDGKRYWLSYKASTRVSEMAGIGTVESRSTEGKLNLYRLIDKGEPTRKEVHREQYEQKCEHGLPLFVACPNCRPVEGK